MIARVQISAKTLAPGACSGQGAKASRRRLGTQRKVEVLRPRKFWGWPEGRTFVPGGVGSPQASAGAREGGGQPRDTPAGLCVPWSALLFSLGWSGEAGRWKGGVLRQIMSRGLNTLPQPTSRNIGN